MLAARRDQENLVHSHPVPSKQLPKTPGTRFPKTPLALRNDENAPTAFAGKTGMGDLATRPGGNDKLTVKKSQQQAIMTPMGMISTDAGACFLHACDSDQIGRAHV